MLYNLRFFFSSKCSLFHNADLFGSCIIHILFIRCVKIKKSNSGAKGLIDGFCDFANAPKALMALTADRDYHSVLAMEVTLIHFP